MSRLYVFIAVVLTLAATATAAAAQDDVVRGALDRADAAFARGAEAMAEDPVAARSHFAEAAADYAQALDRLPGSWPKLQYNLGSALLLSGDVGGAVVAYRRAELLAPSLPRLQETLESTRKMVNVELSPSFGERMLGMLLGWRGTVPRWLMLGTAFAAFIGLWVAAGVRVLSGHRLGPAGIAWLVALAIVPMGLLVLEREVLLDRPHAVVVAIGGVEGLNGPASGVYEASFTRRLPAGTEAVIIEERGDWRHIRLIDGRETWVPASSLEAI